MLVHAVALQARVPKEIHALLDQQLVTLLQNMIAWQLPEEGSDVSQNSQLTKHSSPGPQST